MQNNLIPFLFVKKTQTHWLKSFYYKLIYFERNNSLSLCVPPEAH